MVNPLKPLWDRMVKLVKKTPEADPLAGKATTMAREVDDFVEKYRKQRKVYDGAKGFRKAQAGQALAQIGKEMRKRIVELSHLFDDIKDKNFLRDIAGWRNEVERTLNTELHQQVRLASAERVLRRFIARESGVDVLEPEDVVAAIKKAVALKSRSKTSVPGIRLDGAVKTKTYPTNGSFTVHANVLADGVKTMINISFHPQHGAWFQVASIWANGKKEKNLDEKPKRAAVYRVLLENSLLSHLEESKPGPAH